MSDNYNKVVWIIGGSGGIGSNIARRMSNNGWKVIISARDIEKLNLVSNGKSIESLIVDATNADDVQEKAKEINEKYGSLDAVVNSVGSIFLRPLHATSSEQFMDTINQNLVTSFNVIRATAKIMMRGNGGRIILFSSAAASLGMPNHAAISAAKAGVEGFTRSLAREVGPRNITVNCVAPGFIDTDMTRNLPPDVTDSLTKQIPLGRFGHVRDIASLVSFLCSEFGSYITGETIQVNGGMYLK